MPFKRQNTRLFIWTPLTDGSNKCSKVNPTTQQSVAEEPCPAFNWIPIDDGKNNCKKVNTISQQTVIEEPCPGFNWIPLNNDDKTCNKVNTTNGETVTVEACPVTQTASNPASTPVATTSFSTGPVHTSSIPESRPTPNVGVPPPAANSTAPAISPKTGLSDGAAAGLAIGMLLVGLLVASVVFFFLLRRQKRSHAAAYQPHHVPQNTYISPNEKGPTVAISAVTSSVDELLPQPVADDTIIDQVSKIRDNIKNHVQTYYHSTPVSAAEVDQVALESLATAAGLTTSMLASGLSNLATRADALRLVIAWVILSRSTGERNVSLLPANLSGLASSIAGKIGNDTTQSTLYSKWKTITGALLQQKTVQDASRTQTFAIAVAELDTILAPFVHGSVDGGQRHKNLDMILTRSASFAFLLFSQPGSFRFDFSAGSGGLVAFPALVQTIGDQGQTLHPSRILFKKEIVG